MPQDDAGDARDPTLSAVIDEALAQAPAVPRDPNLFSSNTLFGQPGIYPEGTPMAPAVGDAPDEESARAQLVSVLADRGLTGAARTSVLGSFDNGERRILAPDPLVRAALSCAYGTRAISVLRKVQGASAIRRLGIGAPSAPGRVVGPDTSHPAATHRVVNERYRGEHPALITPSLAHDVLWTPETTDHSTETLLHALVALAHVEAVAASPWLAHLGTELARRQNSLAITLLNSRRPGSAQVSLIAPDGPGTIPGGAPGMQSPDWWSIPFGPEDPGHRVTTLAQLYDDGAPVRDPAHPQRVAIPVYAQMFDRHPVVAPIVQLRANVALGLIDPAPIVASCNDLEPLLAPAMAVWS